jgi:hypothetical protein
VKENGLGLIASVVTCHDHRGVKTRQMVGDGKVSTFAHARLSRFLAKPLEFDCDEFELQRIRSPFDDQAVPAGVGTDAMIDVDQHRAQSAGPVYLARANGQGRGVCSTGEANADSAANEVVLVEKCQESLDDA